MVWQSSTNEDTAFPWWYDEGTPLSRTCYQFNLQFTLHFRKWAVAKRLTQEPPCRFSITCQTLGCQPDVNFFACTVFAICMSQQIWLFRLICDGNNTSYGDESFSLVFGAFQQPLPVRRSNWIVFARKMRSTTKFAMTILSKCVTHASFVKVAWALPGIPV